MTVCRVAYVVNTFPKLSETFIIGELAELRRRGVDLRVLSLRPPEETMCHEAVRTAGLLDRTSYDRRAFDAELESFQAQLVHAHFATEPTAAARAIAAERGLPFTFTAHGYDVYRRPPADFAQRAEAAASIITVSEANRRCITETFRVPRGRVQVIPCGVDTDWFSPGTPDSDPPLVVCVARLREVKRLDLLLRACAIVRDRKQAFGCVIVGEGPERAALESLRADLRLDRDVDMPGAAEHSSVRTWWRRASVAVLSSRSEGMPVSLMEAASCGVAAVATDVGGVSELVEHGVTGLVVPRGDVDQLATAIHELLVDDCRRAAMGASARRRAVRRFSRTAQIDRLLEVWSSVVS